MPDDTQSYSEHGLLGTPAVARDQAGVAQMAIGQPIVETFDHGGGMSAVTLLVNEFHLRTVVRLGLGTIDRGGAVGFRVKRFR